MKLLMLVHDYLPRHVGGTEIHAHQVARELVRRGHDVLALFTERDLSAPEGTLRRGELDGVRTLEMVHQREYADVRDSWLQPLAAELFRSQVREERPDVVHVQHLGPWGAQCITTAAEHGSDVVVTLNDYHLLCDEAVLLTSDLELCTDGTRGDCDRCLRRHPLRRDRWPAEREQGADEAELWRRAARDRREHHRAHLANARRVVCPSRFLGDRFVEAACLREEQIVVLKYGYPGARHEPRARRDGGPLVAGYVGGIYPSKGVHVLVEAIAGLPEGAVRAEVWGALDWFPDYVAGLRETAGASAIDFCGVYEPARVDEVLGRFDVLVVPSIWYENLPLTIQEAFRNGLPVVTSDLGGMAESVEHERSGLLFPRGDAGALGSALQRLADDRALCARLAAGRPHVPTLEETVDRLEEIYAGG